MDEQQIIDQIQREWAAFKAANDARLEEIKAQGSASAETTQKVDRINNAISGLQTQLAELQNTSSRLDDIENRLNRPGAGARGDRLSDEQRVLFANWQGTVQGKEVDPAHVDVELVTNYVTAFRDWARHGERAATDSMRLLNEMSVGSDAEGGYWVTPDMTGRIETLVYETSPIRSLASQQTISTDSLEGDLDLDEASSGWVGETDERPETDTPKVGTWKIEVHEQYAEPKATQKLLDDARISVEAWLAGKVADKFTRQENNAFVVGNGTLKPRGFMTYTAGTPTAAVWDRVEQIVSGHATLVTADGLIDLVFALKQAYRDGAAFGMNQSTEAAIRKLKDGQDNYLIQPDFTQLGTSRMLGFPVVQMPDLADIAASALPIVYGNIRRAYQVVDRAGIRVLRDPYTTKGRVKFYTTKRVGGGVVNFEALKIQKISA